MSTVTGGARPYSGASPLDRLARDFGYLFRRDLNHPQGRLREEIAESVLPGARIILTGCRMYTHFLALMEQGLLGCLSDVAKESRMMFLGMAQTEGTFQRWERPYDGPPELEAFGIVASDLDGGLRQCDHAELRRHLIMPLIVRRALELDPGLATIAADRAALQRQEAGRITASSAGA